MCPIVADVLQSYPEPPADRLGTAVGTEDAVGDAVGAGDTVASEEATGAVWGPTEVAVAEGAGVGEGDSWVVAPQAITTNDTAVR
jgi:hypothetical protein